MLAAWAAEGHPQYQPNEGVIVYISDVGAHLKPLFISNSPPRFSQVSVQSSLSLCFVLFCYSPFSYICFCPQFFSMHAWALVRLAD